jgi:hypothetical protein
MHHMLTTRVAFGAVVEFLKMPGWHRHNTPKPGGSRSERTKEVRNSVLMSRFLNYFSFSV